MICIGESIHIISQSVRTAVEGRDKAVIQELAKRQADKGATYLDLNIGPQKKAGAEVMHWMVETVQEVTDVPLSLDTTNAVAMEAGLKVCQKTPLINSTDSTEERLSALMPLAAKYNSNIIALTLAKGGLPTTADARVELAAECIFPSAAENGIPNERIFLDPLVLTVNGNQNVSNSCPAEIRPLLNRVFLVMMMGASLDSAIIDTLDDEVMETIRIVESRDESTAKGKLYVALYDAYVAMEQFDVSTVDMSDPELSDIAKTIRVMQNETLYAHSYLRM